MLHLPGRAIIRGCACRTCRKPSHVVRLARGAAWSGEVEMSDLLNYVQQTAMKEDIPEIRPGDVVRVHNRIVEGERERVQVFQGTVIRVRRGGPEANFTVRRIASHGVGVERTFLFHSPRVEKVEVLRHSHVRRAKLYFLRGRRGKAARLREKRW